MLGFKMSLIGFFWNALVLIFSALHLSAHLHFADLSVYAVCCVNCSILGYLPGNAIS